jgi:DNA/RNA-binding domain of Phe-tRNA-synthetase-like protein
MLEVSPAWQQAYPGAALGMLAMTDVVNPPRHAQLDQARIALENQLRARYAGQERSVIDSEPTMQAYRTYYKRFKKTYHILLQLESVINGKPIPIVSTLVTAMFIAEMKNQLLTAGHDLDSIHPPLRLDIAR